MYRVLKLNESSNLNEARAHRVLSKDDIYINPNGVKIQIIDVDNEHLLDGEPQVTYKFLDTNETKCYKNSNVVGFINDNGYTLEESFINETKEDLPIDLREVYMYAKEVVNELKQHLDYNDIARVALDDLKNTYPEVDERKLEDAVSFYTESVNTSSKKSLKETEEVKTLYDLIVERGDGIDINDVSYDMMVYADFDAESSDIYNEFMMNLCSSLHCVSYTDDLATVDMYKFAERNFDVFESLFDLSGENKEEEIEDLVCNTIPNIISGYTTDSVYKELNDKCKFDNTLNESKEVKKESNEEEKILTNEQEDSIEDAQDIIKSEEDQEENPIEEEGLLDKELDELREILPDLDLKLYQVTNKEKPTENFYFIGKIADDNDDILMLVDNKPEEINSDDLKVKEPIEVEDEGVEPLENRFDYVKIPLRYEEFNTLIPRYGEGLNPDHQAIMDYLMNCLIEIDPEAAEEIKKDTEVDKELPVSVKDIEFRGEEPIDEN